MKKGELDATELFDASLRALTKAGVLQRLRGTLQRTPDKELLGTYAAISPLRISEAIVEAGAARRTVSLYLTLLGALSAHVTDRFQNAELSRIYAHLRSLEQLTALEKSIISDIHDHDGDAATRDHIRDITALFENRRSHLAAITNAAQSVSEAAPLHENGYENVSSRIVVALVASLLCEALGLEQERVTMPAFGELTPSMENAVRKRVEAALMLINEFAKDF